MAELKTIAFRKVSEPYGWLGNMSPYPVDHLGVIWKTSEALFQAMRFENLAIWSAIREQQSPMAAKMVSKKYASKMFVTPQSSADLDNMRLVLRLKIEQHPELRKLLIATGDARIVEDSSARPHGSGLFWGAALINGEWVGENILGKLWMELRESFGE